MDGRIWIWIWRDGEGVEASYRGRKSRGRQTVQQSSSEKKAECTEECMVNINVQSEIVF